MRRITSRLIQVVVTMALVSAALFALLHAVPGNPALALAGGQNASPQAVAAITREYHLNEPVVSQYGLWVSHLLHGNLGTSIVYQRSVASLIGSALTPTAELIVASLIITVIVAVGLGVLSATRTRRWADLLYVYVTSFILAVPVFWLGLLALLLLAVDVTVFPSSGYVNVFSDPAAGFRDLALPALVLGIGSGCVLARFVRSSMLSVLNSDYIRTARAKGLAERTVVFKHGLRNALIPLITVLGIYVAYLIGGAVVIEVVFTRPGMGTLLVNALNGRDYSVVEGGVLVLVAGFCLINLLIDISYGVIDPRTRR